jgi:Flp pilus assembly protein TadG
LRELKGDCGSGLVEYAIVFLLFMTMILGTIDFGRALYTYHFLSNVTRDATRWAAVNGSTCNGDNSCNGAGYMNTNPATQSDVQTYVKNHTPPGIDKTKITTTVTWPVSADSPAVCGTTTNAPGCTVQVQTSYVFSFLFAFVHKNTVTMSSTSDMIIVH